MGSGSSDALELKRSRFFSVFDFTKIVSKQYEPEFRPPIASSPTDVSNFDKEFTNEVAHDSMVVSHMSSTLQDKSQFANFTYVQENKMK